MKKTYLKRVFLYSFLIICVFLCLSSCGDTVDVVEHIALKGSINVYTPNNSKALNGLLKTEFRLNSQEVSEADFRKLEKEFQEEIILGLEFVNVKKITGVFRNEITSLSDLVFDSALELIGDNCFRTQEYLTSVEFEGENVPSISETAFPSEYKEEGKFYYPSDKEEDYQKILKPFLEEDNTAGTDTTGTDTTNTDVDTTGTNTTNTDIDTTGTDTTNTDTDTTGTDTTNTDTDTTGTDTTNTDTDTTGTDTTNTDTDTTGTNTTNTDTDTTGTDTTNTDTDTTGTNTTNTDTSTTGTNSLYIKKLEIGKENILDRPEERGVYTLLLNIPETFGSGNNISANITPSKSKGSAGVGRVISRSELIPLDTDGNLETDKIKTNRSNVFLPWNGGFTSGTIVYLAENTTNNVLYFIEENAKTNGETPIVFINKDGQEESVSLNYKDVIIPKLDAMLQTAILQAEKDYYNLTGYDADETGYFHVVFCDFGDKKAFYSGELSASGTTGVYNFAHIRDYSETGNPYSNGADMFFVNTRYLEYCTKKFYEYLHSEYPSSVKIMDGDRNMMSTDYFIDKSCRLIIETFLHEYMHYLMDANVYLSYKSGKSGSYVLKNNKTPLFWVEGTAESTASLFTQEKNTNGNLGFVSLWIQNANAFAPYIGEGMEDNYEEHNSLSYGVAPMFFLFIREAYGEEVFKKCCTYTETNNNLNKIIQDCVGKSFSELYREFIIRLFASAAGDSSFGSPLTFLEEWSFSKTGLFANDKYIPAVSDDYSETLVSDEKTTIIDNGKVDITDGCISFIKWSDNPDAITVTSDAENLEAYVLYI